MSGQLTGCVHRVELQFWKYTQIQFVVVSNRHWQANTYLIPEKGYLSL